MRTSSINYSYITGGQYMCCAEGYRWSHPSYESRYCFIGDLSTLQSFIYYW